MVLHPVGVWESRSPPRLFFFVLWRGSLVGDPLFFACSGPGGPPFCVFGPPAGVVFLMLKGPGGAPFSCLEISPGLLA